MKKLNFIKILNAISKEQLDHVRNLINSFVKWHLTRHLEDADLIKEYFDPKDFEKELASLPGNRLGELKFGDSGVLGTPTVIVEVGPGG
jgi:hypothetical protein